MHPDMVSSASSPLLQASPIARAMACFLRWWGEELMSMAPERLRTWLGQDGLRVFLILDEHRARFERRQADRQALALDVALDSNVPALQAANLKRQLSSQFGNDYRLVLSLPPTAFLRRTLRLPLATEENLAQTLTFELDRYTPFKPADACFDFRILQRDPVRQIIEVDLAVVRRSDCDRLIRYASDLGLVLHGLAFNGEILGGHPSPGWHVTAAAPSSRRTLIRIACALLAALLLTTLLAIPIWQKRAAAIAILAPLAAAREAARHTSVLRDRLDGLITEHNALQDKKWASPSLVRVLDELSLRLKDDTFVLNFVFDGQTVVLHGESGSGAELVEILEASPLFHNVLFKSPLTKLQGGTHDRFHIGADISPERGAAPSAAPLAGSS